MIVQPPIMGVDSQLEPRQRLLDSLCWVVREEDLLGDGGLKNESDTSSSQMQSNFKHINTLPRNFYETFPSNNVLTTL